MRNSTASILWPRPGCRCDQCFEEGTAKQRGRLQAMDSASAEVDPQLDPTLKAQTKVANAGQRIAEQRLNSGNDDGDMEEIPPHEPSIGEMADSCSAMLKELNQRKAQDAAIARMQRARDRKERALVARDQQQYASARRALEGKDLKAESGELSPAEVESDGPCISFAAQCKREGEAQRNAYARTLLKAGAAPIQRKKLRGQDSALSGEDCFKRDLQLARRLLESRYA
jgi:hypothetical protein